MNPSATTTLIRSCHARPAPSQCLNSLRTRSHPSNRQSPFLSSQVTSSLPFRRPRQHEQRATFSTTPSVHNAQLLHDRPSSTQSGPSPASQASLLSSSPSSGHLRTGKAPVETTCDPLLLPPSMTEDDMHFLATSPTQLGTVSRVSTMQKTVRVTQKILVWYAPFQKYYHRENHSLVHDPQNLLLEGDVIRFGEFPPSLRKIRDKRGQVVVTRGRPKDRNGITKELGVRYMVREIVTPFGTPLEQRTPRVVGGTPGAWKGTAGEAKKIAMRQKGRKEKKTTVQAVQSKKAAESVAAEDAKEELDSSERPEPESV